MSVANFYCCQPKSIGDVAAFLVRLPQLMLIKELM
jgi:hypothetical protein